MTMISAAAEFLLWKSPTTFASTSMSTSSSVSFRCILISNIVFWIASLLGLYMDYLVRKSSCKTTTISSLSSSSSSSSSFLIIPTTKWWCHKLQQDTIITGKDLKDLIILALFNVIFVSLFICCPLYESIWNFIQGRRLIDSDLWIWHYELLIKLPICMILTDITFYYIHYVFHYSPWLYRNIHKIHHRFPAPTVMTCVYAHPFEFVIGNVLPIYIGPIVTNAHPKTCYLWWSMAMLGTCKGHSGYRILGHADYHEEHHSTSYKHNYGGMYLIDYILGTMLLHSPPPPKK